MKILLQLAQAIDTLNERIGRSIYWLILIMVIISTVNALFRKLFNMSSNAFLEIQWYLFAAVFLLGSGYTLLRNEHVRIDVLSSKLSPKAQIWIDILGTLIFLFPFTLLILYDGWRYFVLSFIGQEWSLNPGGLLVWPAKLLIPVGFLLLFLQGLAQLIKLIGALQGHGDRSALLKHYTPEEDTVETGLGKPENK
ncbi:MAG TPA: TRAP transporter small permease subunit [Candidatus Competibacteraceae bacterium]|nr:TRAP transporter small permease subunit [Candidatus Competibacteraceae bacterium]